MRKSPAAGDDRALMRECLDLASRGAGFASPNPMVGALLVKDGRIIGCGWHHRSGGPHAEVECLKACTEDPRGATMYVNLEPCTHYGKTPPCADRLIAAGLRRVVIAMNDPNRLVNGKGVRKLAEAGLEVTVGVLEREAAYLNRQFIAHIRQRRPYVHVKVAQSLDGKISGGQGKWISSLESRKLVHRWRTTHDAVLVGAGTVRKDHPLLTTRLVKGRNPHIIILDGALNLKRDELRFPRDNGRRVILCTTRRAVRRHQGSVRTLAKDGIEILALQVRGRRIQLPELLHCLYQSGVSSILVEGGSDIFTQFAGSGLVDEWSVFIAPRLLGRGIQAFHSTLDGSANRGHGKVNTLGCYRVGKDVLLRGFKRRYDSEIIGPS
ncbi:MAG: bifunctional diaminohydroxyphosphoribosylaminopyrimidine deaminase/5-amino-6-(5-phosphoribosylamino)uracil reductase RibD [Bacteroidota bacterium]